jgi:putative S-cspCI
MTAISPKVNFIGRSNFNNGITEKVDLIKGIEPYEAGNLTLSLGGAYLGSCFVQKEPFYTSQNVVVLIPKLRMSEYCKKFIATMVFKESQTYYKAFENELNRHIKSDFSIYLPVKTDNSPDWEYMETYMRNLEKTLKNMIKANNHSVNVS